MSDCLTQEQVAYQAYRHVAGLNDEWFVHRATTQPTSEYNCGSVFRNPPGNFAARLIESCGLKGKQLGGAVVSTKHANFIINHEGNASAQDIESLITLVRNTVNEQTQVELIQEVHIIGDSTNV